MKNNAWKRVREQNMATLYADDEPYVEYIKRMPEESVQYKPKEENAIEKYMNYEVEEEKEIPKEPTDWFNIVIGTVFYGALIGLLIYAIVKVVNGG